LAGYKCTQLVVNSSGSPPRRFIREPLPQCTLFNICPSTFSLIASVHMVVDPENKNPPTGQGQDLQISLGFWEIRSYSGLGLPSVTDCNRPNRGLVNIICCGLYSQSALVFYFLGIAVACFLTNQG